MSKKEKPFLIGSLLGKDLLICDLCSEYYKDPRILPCDNTFCRKCLQDLVDQKQAKSPIKVTSFNCPKCRTVVAVPQIGVSGFPLDLNIRKMKETFMNKLIDNIGQSKEENVSAQSTSRTGASHRLFPEKPEGPPRSYHSAEPTSPDSPSPRNRTAFAPRSKHNQMVDGLIRSRRERSPHVATRTPPSIASYYSTTEINTDDAPVFPSFSGSRPSRIASRKIHQGSRYKSDPGLMSSTPRPKIPENNNDLDLPDSNSRATDHMDMSGPFSPISASDKATENTETVDSSYPRSSRARRNVRFEDIDVEELRGKRTNVDQTKSVFKQAHSESDGYSAANHSQNPAEKSKSSLKYSSSTSSSPQKTEQPASAPAKPRTEPRTSPRTDPRTDPQRVSPHISRSGSHESTNKTSDSFVKHKKDSKSKDAPKKKKVPTATLR